MKIQFNETTRGRGKIFIHVTADEELKNYDVRAVSRTADGDNLPCMLLSSDDVDGIVAVLMVINRSQTISIDVKGESGQIVCSAKKVIRPKNAKVASSFNTLSRNKVAESIRNIDTKITPTWPGVDLDAYIDGYDGTAILLYRVTLKAKSKEELLDIDVTSYHIGESGKNIALNDPVFMGESFTQPGANSGYYARDISYSVQIPGDERSFAIWIQTNSKFGDNFYNYESFYVDMRKQFHHSVTLSAERDPEYHNWFVSMHRANAAALEYQRGVTFAINPVFSIIVPLYKTPLLFFDEMVQSVLNQTYPYFELILVDASPENDELTVAAQRYVEKDDRIKLIMLDENKGITENTNVGILAAKGDFLAFLDHDDILEPSILYNYVKGINDYPDTDLLYCDEDKYLEGRYVSPFFKPDFNIDLLCSQNYICHMLSVRKDIVDTLELPTKEFDGAQDHHMTLRVAEKARNIYHARKVLYHWRIHAESTAASADSKSYTSSAGLQAVQSHYDRMGIKGKVRTREGMPNTYAFDYDIAGNPLVSIVIPNRDLVPLLDRCLKSIYEKSTYQNYEIIIVENNSSDETLAYYEKAKERDSRVKIAVYQEKGSFSFSKVVNFGVSKAHGEYILLLNNDTEVITDNWIERMLGICQREDVGAVGAKLLYPNGTIQHAGVVVFETGPDHIGKQMITGENKNYYYSIFQLTKDYSAVTGACLMTSKETYDELGGLDEALAVDFNDVDYCLRLNARGLLCVYEPEVVLYHYESISRGEHISGDKGLLFMKERGIMMQRYPEYYVLGDPCYSTHLTGKYMALEKLKP